MRSDPPGSRSSDESRRLGRLHEDLADIGLARQLSPHFAHEVLYALFPPVHEQLVPNYGAIALEPFASESEGVRWVQLRLPFPIAGVGVLTPPLEPEEGRQLCDGYLTFFNCDTGEVTTLGTPATELDLVDLQFRQGITTVQRTGDGKVKVFFPQFMAVHDRNIWTARPYSRRMLEPITSVHRPGSRVGARLLDLAVHVLSPAHVGATIVWLLNPNTTDSTAFRSEHRRPIGALSVLDDGALSAMRSLCSQNDRAVIIDLDGRVVGYNVELRWEPDGALTVAGGTRHNSAANASRLDPHAVFFVVSSDGPVSVFFSGQKIASFEAGAVQVECPACMGSGFTGVAAKCDRCGGAGRTWDERSMLDRASRPRRWGIPVHGVRQRATLHMGDNPGEFIVETAVVESRKRRPKRPS